MITIAFSDPAVQAALISAVGSVAATTIAAVCAGVIGRRYTNQQKLKEELAVAINDIHFLLAVEEEHCKLHTENSGKAMSLATATLNAQN